MAGMTLLVELHTSTSLQVAVYFSIVRRRACWASFVSLSTSVRTTTGGREREGGERGRGGGERERERERGEGEREEERERGEREGGRGGEGEGERDRRGIRKVCVTLFSPLTFKLPVTSINAMCLSHLLQQLHDDHSVIDTCIAMWVGPNSNRDDV